MTVRLGAFALLGGGVFGALMLAGCGGHENAAAHKAETAVKPVPVTVAPLEHRSVLRTVDVVGTLRGWEDVTIGAKRDGRVVKVLHDMGDRVKPGELLVQLESEGLDLEILQAQRQHQAHLAKLGLKELPEKDFDVTSLPAVVQARVALERARQNLARERSLVQRNAGAMQDYQNAENDERSAEAALANAILTAQTTLADARTSRVAIDLARNRRADMEIHVPIPSAPPAEVTAEPTYAVAKRHVSEGQMVKAGEAIAELVIERPLRLWVSVPERYGVDVQVGQPVGLKIASHPDTNFEGKVARINPLVDATSRTFQVEAIIPNNRGLLRPGGFAKAAIVTSRNSEASVVPIESVSTYAGVTKVFIVDGNKVRAVPVQTGLQGTGWIEVIGDLPAEAQVVTTGQVRLAEGTPIVIHAAEPAATAKNDTTPSTSNARRDGDKGVEPVAQAAERHPG
jgi:multidrug efflux pump subunit AcrA (membrane-fusion protein)